MASSQIGRSVRSARARLGWSRETLAHHSGLSSAAIAQIETGRRREARLGSLLALARALAVTIDYLAGATGAPSLLDHRAAVYGSDDEYLAATVPFVVEGIASSDCVVAVTAPRHASLLREALGPDAAGVEFHDATEWYRTLDGASNGYRELLRDRCTSVAPWARIVAEPVWAGWTETQLTAWLRYESLMNLVLASSPATIVCTYDERAVPAEVLAGARHTHPGLADGGDVTANPAYRAPENYLVGPG